jgi:hypothetical protein
MSIQAPFAPPLVRDERDDVVGWRIERLLAAGYDGESALGLALDRSVDVHVAVTILEHGCPVETSLQILF